MARQVQLRDGEVVKLEEEAFASGGEGDLFRIISPDRYKHLIVKVYKPEKQTDERRQKIEYLIANPSDVPQDVSHPSVVWPKALIFIQGKFAGFMMPLAKGEKLEVLCQPSLSSFLSNEWKRFDFKDPSSLNLRLLICYNIAAALHNIHRMGNYVLVDMKPDNILIRPDGLISLIDIDSVEIMRHGQLLFDAPVATPEYTPPEYYRGVRPERQGAKESWDRFSVAVIFYRLLFGIHPFTGSCLPPFDKCNSLDEMVKNGLFPNGKNALAFKVMPPPHQKFRQVEASLQELFIQCFDEGHARPDARPTANEWCMALYPKKAIRIDRSVPSKKARFEGYGFTNAIQPGLCLEISLPAIHFLNLDSEKGIRSFTRNLFHRLPRYKLELSIIQQEHIIKELFIQKEVLEKEIQTIIRRFKVYHDEAILQEKEQFNKLRSAFESDVSRLDNMAGYLMKEEEKELEQLQRGLLEKLAKINEEIRNSYRDIVGVLEGQYDSKIGELERELQDVRESGDRMQQKEEQQLQQSIKAVRDEFEGKKRQYIAGVQKEEEEKLFNIRNKRKIIEEEERKEVERMANDPARGGLSQYRISEYASRIFFDGHTDPNQLASSLARNGIITAADFIAVDGPMIKKIDGSWIRISGIAEVRARALYQWRMRLPAIPAPALTKEEINVIKGRFEQQYNKLQNEENSIRNEMKAKIDKADIILAMPRQASERAERKLREEANERREVLKVGATIRHKRIAEQLEKMKKESVNTLTPLRKKMSIKEDEFLQRKKEIQVETDMATGNVRKKYDDRHKELYLKINES